MGAGDLRELSPREREIMDSVYRRGRPTVAEIREDLVNAPTASAVRTMLKRLEEKGHLRSQPDGPRKTYRAVLSRERAKRSALDRVLKTFFEGSPLKAVAELLDRRDAELGDPEELERVAELIDEARRREGDG